MGEGYDVAQICLNGHVTNESTQHVPQHSQDFCEKCGQPTITACLNCETPIRGAYWSLGWGTFDLPAFCGKCGETYPWTETKIEAAREMALELEDLDQDDRDALAGSIDDLVRETPLTPAAATRSKRILGKVGQDAYEAFRKILVDVVSDAARKLLWPG